jgi:DnaD/phage-associated family protein
MIAEELKLAEKDYPPGWIELAIREAVKNNVRRWAYIDAILKRMKIEGPKSRNKDTPVPKRGERPLTQEEVLRNLSL